MALSFDAASQKIMLSSVVLGLLTELRDFTGVRRLVVSSFEAAVCCCRSNMVSNPGTAVSDELHELICFAT